jgi:hypothetical protein
MSVKKTAENGIGKGKAGPGRPKGVPNKNTTAVKDMILQALSNKGGVKYLEKQADENPTAFLTLVGKVLPLDVNANVTTTPPAYTVDEWVIPAIDDHQVGHA